MTKHTESVALEFNAKPGIFLSFFLAEAKLDDGTRVEFATTGAQIFASLADGKRVSVDIAPLLQRLAELAQEPYVFRVGQRVRLRHDVERYDSGIARAGLTGTVTALGTEPGNSVFAVKLDTRLPWLDEWENELQWLIECGDSPAFDLQIID
jgi:hypothetical protein